MLFGEFNENINTYGFVFGDLKYFDWFKNGEHFEESEINRFRNALIWKGLKVYTSINGLNNTWNDYQEGNLDSYPVVTRAFLNHLRDPIKFAIFDKHVWKAMRVLNPEIAARTPEESNQIEFYAHYLGEYQNFFNYLYENSNINAPHISDVDEEIVKRRVLDRSLWLYGKILNDGQ